MPGQGAGRSLRDEPTPRGGESLPHENTALIALLRGAGAIVIPQKQTRRAGAKAELGGAEEPELP